MHIYIYSIYIYIYLYNFGNPFSNQPRTPWNSRAPGSHRQSSPRPRLRPCCVPLGCVPFFPKPISSVYSIWQCPFSIIFFTTCILYIYICVSYIIYIYIYVCVCEPNSSSSMQVTIPAPGSTIPVPSPLPAFCQHLSSAELVYIYIYLENEPSTFRLFCIVFPLCIYI